MLWEFGHQAWSLVQKVGGKIDLKELEHQELEQRNSFCEL
jgi:hypothetical protein